MFQKLRCLCSNLIVKKNTVNWYRSCVFIVNLVSSFEQVFVYKGNYYDQ